jgi:crotonobetainyl-CoA:carnitine CoA-transferase CaiB-like acyl-CoA transferase
MAGPLENIRVVDFTHALNGPFCTMLLGHLGAEIIKIEPPTGDGYRRTWMPRDAKTDAYEFIWINVNKKSVVLDLKSERGIDLARQLISRADVLVENYQKGVMERFGLDYDSIKQDNPRLIYACSRGFGEWGPYADYGNTAATNNSIAGWTHSAWEDSGAPGTRVIGVGDEAAGVSMTVGILAALNARQQSGRGQKIEVSMQEAVLGFMVSSFHQFFTGNKVGTRPMQVADGYFTLRSADVSDEDWPRLARVIGRAELIDDPRFAAQDARRLHRAELDGFVRAWAQRQTRQAIWDGLRDLGYFGAPVLSLAEVIDDPHIKARQAFIDRDHPAAGPTKLVAPWIRLSETPASIRADAPALGQHTDEVLGELLGLNSSRISALRDQGAVK